MRKLLAPIAYLTIFVSSLLLIREKSPENFEAKQTRESRKISKIVNSAQDELFEKLYSTYVVSDFSWKNDTLKIMYESAKFSDTSAHCGVASGILKKILKEKGLETQYVVLKGNREIIDYTPTFASMPQYRGGSSAHVFLKTGNVYIDPTWWQFFTDSRNIKNRIAVGTKENLYDYYLRFNYEPTARFITREDRMNHYFARFRKPEELDPNLMVNLAAALYAENSSDTIKIPLIYNTTLDAYLLQELLFFREKTLSEPRKIKYLDESFENQK